jgi:hypothetical protein
MTIFAAIPFKKGLLGSNLSEYEPIGVGNTLLVPCYRHRKLSPPMMGHWRQALYLNLKESCSQTVGTILKIQKSVLGRRINMIIWLRISMDRISDSDSEDAGSIPAGATTEQTKEIKTA